MTSSRLKVVCALTIEGRLSSIHYNMLGWRRQERGCQSPNLLSIYHFLASFAFLATAIWYLTWSNPVPPKEFRL